MKNLLVSAFLIIGFTFTAQAQNQHEEAIMNVVNQVFEAMRTNDSTLLKQCFVENPNTFTVFTNKQGEVTLATDNFQKFVDAVGKPKERVWNEPIWNEKVEIDGPLASVWVDYAFFIDDQFSHCGVDAFHLVKKDNRWQIFHLVDTRRKADCVIPEEIKP